MIYFDVEQGSGEWEALRLGIPTASQFDKILTPAKLEPTSSRARERYMNTLIAEWLLGHAIEYSGPSGWMDRGTRREPEARKSYEFERDATVTVPGFIMRDDRKVGGSPDGLIGADGGLEIKVPAIHTHIGYMRDPASLVAEYRLQVQGYMYLTERAWWDVESYDPDGLPPVIVRTERAPEVMVALDDALGPFLDELDEAKRRLAEHRLVPDRSPLPDESSYLLRQLERSLEAVAP